MGGTTVSGQYLAYADLDKMAAHIKHMIIYVIHSTMRRDFRYDAKMPTGNPDRG